MHAAGSYFVVTQVKSQRVVYFTDDEDYHPPQEGDWYYVTHHKGAIPVQMTLRNCWRWRFTGSAFIDAGTPARKSTQELLIDSNRRALRGILRDKIDGVRAPFAPRAELGDAVRREKLQQALDYLRHPHDDGDYALLQGVALARGIPLADAARLVIAKATETRRVMEQSEWVREQFSLAIGSSRTPEGLMELRERLLEDVYPALSKDCRFPLSNTVPLDTSKPLAPQHRVHEKSRLRTLLRLSINQLRMSPHDEYVGGAQLHERRLRAARAVVEDREPDAGDLAMLQDYAAAHDAALAAVAELLHDAASCHEHVLAWTECERLRLSRQIDDMESLEDLAAIEAAIRSLESPANHT